MSEQKTHPGADVPTKPASKRVMNLAHFLLQQARRQGTETALVWGEKSWSWSELNTRVDAMALALKKLGVKKGDKVLVQSKNCNQLFESMFVCFRLGAVWVPANFRQTPDEIIKMGKTSQASIFICHQDFSEHAKAVTEQLPEIKQIIVGGSEAGEDYESLVKANLGQEFKAANVEYDDPCWFFFTSGTTGAPKAAVLTHGQMSFVITNHLCDLMPAMTPQDDASLVVAPLSHGAGIHQLAQVARGVKSILLAGEKFDPAEAWHLVEKWRVSNMFTVPSIVSLLVEDKAVEKYDHSSLKYVIYAGAPMYRKHQKFALEKLGKVLVQYFGLGEVTGNITILPPYAHDVSDDKQKIGSCGYERTGMQVSIQNDKGEELEAGQTGEICVCGPAVFFGYYNNPEANEKAFRAGWFLTGDLGHLDKNGYLFITGRASDMYISGGSNIYPREIEEKLLAHPTLSEVAVLGVPDERWGEVGVAICVLREGQNLSADELLKWMDGKISRYKLPKRVFFWDELPKSAYGKVTKKNIMAALEAKNCMAKKGESE
ncbi:MAG: acyl-CoA synthetase [Devosiaceae bacterium]|nr:acyl-CoA synthetase [Devosiaceae bacterium]